jgi:dCMP deaminase
MASQQSPQTLSKLVSNNSNKRTDYISWNDYFMSIAILSSMRSKDPSTQVGACIINDSNKIIGIGYNGFPSGCDDDDLPWQKDSDNFYDNKYAYVCHAEMNAILNKNNMDLTNCTIYTTLFPCNECAKLIIQAKINKIIYKSDKDADKDFIITSKRMLDMTNTEYIQYESNTGSITITL